MQLKYGLKTAGEQTMLYRYDQLNRIKTAVSSQNTYQTGYSYDANGNILSLLRKNQANNTIDNLSYAYNTNVNNRLNSVNDGSGNDEGLEANGVHSYTYDDIGNLTSDKDIETINWTVYGKIESVLKRDGTEINYKYDGTGQRIYKKVATTTVTKETHYVRDGSGNVLAIYENEVLDELVIYGSSRLGSYNAKTDQGKRTLGNKKYELSNHLGNVLSVISDNKIGIGTNGVADYYEPLVISESDYYPFGMAMAARSFSNEEYRFGFNGMEKDGDLGEGKTDYDARIYDEKLGRWLSCDPLEWKYPSLSTFSFSNNSPIMLRDYNGKEFEITIHNIKIINGQATRTSIILKVVRSEDGLFSLDNNHVKMINNDKKGTISMKDVKDANQVIKFLNYTASTENEESKQIFELLAKPLTDSGEGIVVNLSYDASWDINSAHSIANPLQITGEKAEASAGIDITKTIMSIDKNQNVTYQSGSVHYGTHELGHIFEKIMIAINGGQKFGLSEQEIESFKLIHNKLRKMYKDGDNSYGEKTQGLGEDEFIATVIQNYFAEGLGEPQKPSYSGSSSNGDSNGENKFVPNVTENSNNPTGN